MALDDLFVDIRVQSPELADMLREMVRALATSKESLADIHEAFRRIVAANQQLSRLSDSGFAKPLEFARVRMNSMLRGLQALTDQQYRYQAAFQTVVVAIALKRQAEKWNEIQRLVSTSRVNLIRYNATARETQRIAAATSVRTAIPNTERGLIRTQPEPAGGGLMRLASLALTVRAMTGVQTALKVAKVAVADIGKTANVTAGYMDRFRLGLAAPAADQSMNVVKNTIDRTAQSLGGIINTVRGVADAVMSDLPGALGSAATGAATLSGELDTAALTMSKHLSRAESLSKGLTLLSNVFPFARGKIEGFKSTLDTVINSARGVSDKIDAVNGDIAAAANTARSAEFVMSGTFRALGGSADLFARAQYHALLPLRLLKRETEGATRVVRAAAHVWNFATHPLHAIALSAGHARAEFRAFRDQLPALTGIGFGNWFAAQMAKMTPSTTVFRRITDSMEPLLRRVNEFRNAAGSMAAAGVDRISSAMSPVTSRIRVFGVSVATTVGALELGTRAHRAFAHATYFTASALRGVGKVLSPITWTAGKLWNLVRPAKAAQTAVTGLNGSAQRAGFVLRNVTRAADGTFQSLTKVGRSGAAAASSGLGSLFTQARLGTVALGVMAASGVAFGVKMAASAETSRVVFGTMLKDMDQGRQLLADMQNWSGAPMFDAKAIEDTGRALIKAGVAPAGLVEKMDQLGNIATATKQPIEDLARWYQRGMSVGRFGQGAVNDLAERGVDIYHALEAVTGKSGVALQQMMEAGKIGPAEINAALEHLTTGTGIYSGALANVSQTSDGLWARMKNNVLQALGSLMGVGLEAFKPFMAKAVAATELVKTSITAIQPVLMQVVQAMSAALNGVWSVVSAVFGGIGLAGAMSFQYLLDLGLTWATRFRWFFENFGTLAQFAFSKMALFAVSSGNDIAYLFTDQIPTYLNWFGENWANVLIDAGNLTASVFENMGTNIVSAMTEIWDFIASGGTDSLQFAWTPLTEGFQKTVSELPKIPARALSELELEMQASVENLGTTLADGYDAAMRDATAKLPEMPQVTLSNQGATESGGTDTTAAGGQRRTSFLVEALDRGSQAALNAIFSAQGRGSGTPEKQLSEQKKQTGLLQKIANRPAPRIAPAV